MRTNRTMTGGLTAALLSLTCCAIDSGVQQPPRTEARLRVRVQDQKVEEAFLAAQKKWTRRVEIYDRMDARSFFAATLLSPEFVEALDARDASLGLLPLAEAHAAGSCSPAILLGTYMHDSRLDDFAHQKSVWQISLQMGSGTALRPGKIRRISRPDHRLRTSFPFLDRFWTGYLIVFESSGALCGGGQSSDAEPNAGQNAASTADWNGSVLELNSIVGRASMRFGQTGQIEPPAKSP